MTKTAGTATFTGNVQGSDIIINGNGGTLNLGTGLTHVFSGNWTRTRGTLNGGSSILKIGGSVSGTGGTFTPSTGTVEWNATGVQTLAGVTYNNLTLSSSGIKTTTGVIVNGILSMEGTATASAAIVFGGSGTLKYSGSTAQTTTGAEFPASSGPANLTINNSNGVSLAFDRILSGNLTINSAAVLTINPGISLTVSGTVANSAGNAGLQIKSDATATGNIIHNNSGVAATVERYITGDATIKPMHYISSPVSNASVNNIWQTGDYNVYWYDETKTTSTTSACWTRIWGNSTLSNTKGYSIVSQYLNRTNIFIGNLTVPSDISSTIPVTYTNSATPANNGWNLIGNPYPCAINASAFVTANTSAFDAGYAAIYYWNDIDGVKNGSQDYATHNSTGGTAAPGNPTNVPNNQVSVGQGFFVKVASGTTTLSMVASMRTTNNSPQFFITDPPEIQRIWVSVNGPNDLYNEMLLGFFDGATTGIDPSYDAIKFRGNSNIALYSIMDGYNEGFAIQALPSITQKTIVKLGLGAGIAGRYSFTVKNIKDLDPKVSIFLKDLVTGTVTDIRKDSTYQVTLNPGEYTSRFVLQFYQNATTIYEKAKPEAVDIYTYYNKIYISGQINSAYPITITDIAGRLAGTFYSKSGSVTEINTDGLSGIYLVSVPTIDGIVTKKILCRIVK